MPETSGEIRPRLIETLEKMFGIRSLRKVQFRIDALEAGAAPEIQPPAVPVSKPASPVSGEC